MEKLKEITLKFKESKASKLQATLELYIEGITETTEVNLSTRWQWSRSKVRKFLEDIKELGFVVERKSRNTIIKAPIKSTYQEDIFESLWGLYPLKQGKKDAKKGYQDFIISGGDNKELEKAVKLYVEIVENQRLKGFDRKYQTGKTFFTEGYKAVLKLGKKENEESRFKELGKIASDYSQEEIEEMLLNQQFDE